MEYHILLSPTYQVPVLYLHLHNPPPGTATGHEAVADLLVAKHAKPGLTHVGVMGGLSMGVRTMPFKRSCELTGSKYQPVTNMPAYFIHPCNTPDAMLGVTERRLLSAEQYLLLWLGLVGSCVDLYVPSELLQQHSE